MSADRLSGSRLSGGRFRVASGNSRLALHARPPLGHHRPMVQFAGMTFDLPTGWLDITDDLPGGSPSTLARQMGAGVIQFSVAVYRSGAQPAVDEHDLRTLLSDFGQRQGLELEAHQLNASQSDAVFGIASGSDGNTVIWYVSDGRNVALISYFADGPRTRAIDDEIDDAMALVRSASFAAPVSSA